MGDSDPFDPQWKVSYLQARDPSILSWNRHGIDKVRHNLVNDFESASSLSSILSEKEDNHIKVYLRIKDGVVDYSDIYTVEEDSLTCRAPAGSHASRHNKDNAVLKKYHFTQIFGPQTAQKDLFNQILKPKILNFINGRNTTFFAYGASGTGKTFTMIGSAEQPGIIPRALEYLFRTLPALNGKPVVKPHPSGKIGTLTLSEVQQEMEHLQLILPQASTEKSVHIKTYKAMQKRLSSDGVATVQHSPTIINVYVSFTEIYNEFVYDLLQPPPQRGHQKRKLKIGGLQDNIYIKDLKYVYVRSGLEAYQILQYGLNNLKYADTAVNFHSSRSHCIFTIRLVQGWDVDNSIVSTFNFCDLAGSERLKKTLNVGDRLKESNNINSSLMVLGRCISAIRDGQSSSKDNTMAPFRESKLTQLFQRALIGKEDIVMIININPSPDVYDESQHTLNFAGIAKEIVIEEAPPRVLKPNRFSNCFAPEDLMPYVKEDETEEELRELRNERADLILELSELRREQEETVEAEREHLRKLFGEIIHMKDAQIKKLEKQNKKLFEEKEQAQQVIVLSDDDDEECEIVSNLRNENQKFKTEVYNFKEQISALMTENKKLTEDLHEAQQTIEEAKTDFKAIVNENNELRKKNQDLRKEKVILQDQLETIEMEVQDLRASNNINRENFEILEEEKIERTLLEESNRNHEASMVSTPDAPRANRASSNPPSNPPETSPIQLADLQNFLQGIAPIPTTQQQPQQQSVDLSTTLTGDALTSIINNPEALQQLQQHLPPIDGSTQEALKSTLASPQFQQAVSQFSSALESGQLGPVVSQLAVNPDAVAAAASGNMQDFVKALEKSGAASSESSKDKDNKGAKKDSKKDEDDEEMQLD